MPKLNVDMYISVRCVCGEYLEQVFNRASDIATNAITLKVCPHCAEEIRSEAYNKGLENGIIQGKKD
jgi:hypothetical protein